MKISAFTTPSVSAVTNRLVRRSRRLIPLMGRREIGGIDVDHFQTADLRQRVKRSVLRFAGKVGATAPQSALHPSLLRSYSPAAKRRSIL